MKKILFIFTITLVFCLIFVNCKNPIVEENTTHPNYLYVTSVIQDVNGITQVITTNNTPKDKTLVVKSESNSSFIRKWNLL